MNKLDAEELFYLAIESSRRGDIDKSILFLKQAYDLDPQARTQYLLAAQYAQIGMYDRAVSLMETAVAADANLLVAHIQLGLLHLTQGRPEKATLHLEKLSDPRHGALYDYALGIRALAKNDFESANACLRRGIERDAGNESLRKDIENIVLRLSESPPVIERADELNKENQFLLSAYNRSL